MSSSETTSVSQNSHSLNERKEDNYRRDSFDDRFCDDLSEVLLQFLSLEDRLRLECVSQQFQRTIFQIIDELYLDERRVSVIHKLKQLVKKFQRLDCLQKLNGLSIAFMESNFRLILSQLKAFPALKTLKLWADYPLIDFTFSFKRFKGFSNITHLSLYLNLCNQSKNEEMLKQIDINLPKLKYLEIRDIFDTTPEGVHQIADILSRLSRLETLKLKFEFGVDFKPIEEQITKKCTKIKEIDIRSVSVRISYHYFELEEEYESQYDNYSHEYHNYCNYGYNYL